MLLRYFWQYQQRQLPGHISADNPRQGARASEIGIKVCEASEQDQVQIAYLKSS
jgi:hypothetical protein